MIKVLEAISDSNIGGAGRLLLGRLSLSDRKIFNTTVIVPKQSKLKAELEKIGISVAEIGRGDSSFSLLDLPAYYRTVKKLSPHIVNAHADITFRIASAIARIPVRLYTRHCAYKVPKVYELAPVRAMSRAFFDLTAHRAIAVAHAAADNLISMGVRREKIKVIINGVPPLERLSDARRLALMKKLDIPLDAKVVSIFARLEKCKDHETFLRAAKMILKQNRAYRFLIVGDGSLAQYLKRYAASLGISEQVRFTGFVGDVAPYMNITDVNVNCSVGTETSSLALSEGMSIGIPAVASDYGGNPYMIRDRVNGLLYRQGDHRELARKILELEDAALYERLSRGAYERYCEELNAAEMTRQTENLYKSLYFRLG